MPRTPSQLSDVLAFLTILLLLDFIIQYLKSFGSQISTKEDLRTTFQLKKISQRLSNRTYQNNGASFVLGRAQLDKNQAENTTKCSTPGTKMCS